MGLTSGTRLDVYEIVALIGSGDMGEVYRSRDAKLQRESWPGAAMFPRSNSHMSRSVWAADTTHSAGSNGPSRSGLNC